MTITIGVKLPVSRDNLIPHEMMYWLESQVGQRDKDWWLSSILGGLKYETYFFEIQDHNKAMMFKLAWA